MKFSLKSIGSVILGLCWLPAAQGATTNLTTLPPLAPGLADTGASVIRVIGAFLLVIGLFFAGVWMFRHWQRAGSKGGRAPKLNLIESRHLGGRQALHVVGYEQARFLITTSPAGTTLLSHLPDAPADEPSTDIKAPPTFSVALAQMLKGK